MKKQNKILKIVRDCGPIQSPPPSNNVLHRIREFMSSHTTDVLQIALGDAGFDLLEFANQVDADHPGLVKLADGHFINSSKDSFGSVLLDICELVAKALEEKRSRIVVNALASAAVSLPLYSWISCTLRPSDNQRYVRLLSSSDERWRIRSTKGAQSLYFDKLASEDFKDAWKNKYPRDMSVYVRGNEVYAPDIEEAQKRMEHFHNFNMPTMVSEIEKSVERMKAAIADNLYLGFHKVNLEDAAYVMAKMHGFELISSDLYGYSIKPRLSSLNGDQLIYHPMVVPYHLLKDIAPTDVQETIEFLENFPELSEKPAFDHFRVLVPEVRYLDSSDRQAMIMSKELIEKQEIIPLLFGEYDGTHYFVCYWM